MKNKPQMEIRNYIYLLSLLLMTFSSCSKDENENKSNEQNKETIVSQDGFLPGDEVTRSILIYGKDGLVLNWSEDDQFGIFPTAGAGTTNTNNIQQVPFRVYRVESNPQEANIRSDASTFQFLTSYKYTAYFPYRKSYNNKDLTYDNIPFDFSNQTQTAYVNMGAFYRNGQNFNNPDYKNSEQAACQHLVGADVLISPEMTPEEDQRMYFRMRHIGAVGRFYLLTPAKILKLKELKLICNNKIFSERGTVTLASHPYNKDYVPSKDPLPLTGTNNNGADNNNYGVCLPQFKNHQLTIVDSEKTDHLTLKFNDGSGSITNLYNTDKTYGHYFMSYMMMYPVVTTDADNVYIYVTAEDETGNEVYLRSGRLANKSMYSGYVYQWTMKANEIYPIELTATLLPWQDIVADGINTDLEK